MSKNDKSESQRPPSPEVEHALIQLIKLGKLTINHIDFAPAYVRPTQNESIEHLHFALGVFVRQSNLIVTLSADGVGIRLHYPSFDFFRECIDFLLPDPLEQQNLETVSLVKARKVIKFLHDIDEIAIPPEMNISITEKIKEILAYG